MSSIAHSFQKLESLQAQRLSVSAGHKSAYSYDQAQTRIAIHRNRYADIVPFDNNRVKLSGKPDYINASWIECHGKWIAAQGLIEQDLAHQ